MKPADQPGAVCFSAPGCDDLPVVRVQYGDVPALVSAWELTDEEVREVQEHGRIWLSIWGDRHPPVALTTSCPYNTRTA